MRGKMAINSGSHYLLFHVIDDVEGETHLVVDLALVQNAIDALVMSFVNMLNEAPGAFRANQAEMRIAIESEAAFLLDDYDLGEAVDDWEEEHGGPPLMLDALTSKQFSPDMDIAVVAGEDLMTLTGHDYFREWPAPYRAQFVLRPDETGHGVYLLPEIAVEGKYKSHVMFYGNGGYQKWSDIRPLMPTKNS